MTACASAALLRIIESRAAISLPAVEILLDAVQTIEVAPRECAFREGEVAPYVYIVRTGLLKQYYVGSDGSEWIKSFSHEGQAFACLESFAPGGRTSFASEAIEPSVVERMPYRVIDELAERHPSWQKGLRWVLQALAIAKIRRERDLLMLSAAQLYERFAIESPRLVQRVPQKDLAGFLGVTPVGLNRIVRWHRFAVAPPS